MTDDYVSGFESDTTFCLHHCGLHTTLAQSAVHTVYLLEQQLPVHPTQCIYMLVLIAVTGTLRLCLVLWLVVWPRRKSARDVTGPVSDPPALMSLSALQCVVQKFMPKEFVVICHILILLFCLCS